MVIGVLALQGAFIEHQKMLKALAVDAFEIRQKKDLDRPMNGLIIPGGESTVMYKLLVDLDMADKITTLITSGLPVFGTCAGLLLLANVVHNYKNAYLQTMDIVAMKNAYGRQLGSFRTTGTFNHTLHVEFVFIRAPYIERVGKDVEVLAVVDEKIVAARQGNQLVTAFHPELTNDLNIHQYFVKMCEDHRLK